MKGVKGKFLKKLKSIGQMGPLKPSRLLQVNASDGSLDPLPPYSGHVFKAPPPVHESEPDIIDISVLMRDLGEDEETELDCGSIDKENIRPPAPTKISMPAKENSERENRNFRYHPEPNVIDVSELMRDLGEDEETELDCGSIDKENIQPPAPTKISMPAKENSERENCNSRHHRPLLELDISCYRRPDLNSGSLFDPDLLAAFQQAVMNHKHAQDSENRSRCESQNLEKEKLHNDPLLEFEERCPPGGTNSVVLYTTSIRGIRKTFEDCNSIRFILGGLKILYSERDVSMHLEFREELWRILSGRVVPPRLFIKGRYIGGADEVLGLHEQGKLIKLLQGMPIDRSRGMCNGCGGVRFVLCFKCSGSCKIAFDDGELPVRCPSCNENGLILCPSCC